VLLIKFHFPLTTFPLIDSNYRFASSDTSAIYIQVHARMLKKEIT